MKEKLLETDALAEYKKAHKNNYEQRLIREKELLEKEQADEIASERIKKEQAYKQLQIEKDREYSLQYYHEINGIRRANTVSTDDGSPMLSNYTERLISSPHYTYMSDGAPRGILGDGSRVSFSRRIRDFFSSR
ncbi:hypothetical protein PVIIG_04457 [Plasmodium vivax India VII]|uniref:Uncharacterized protein n=5 Tax=Plasmodium vivax TaxID=5855 RepID=A5K5B9_PLAVS|nr:hypothetical protein, conserved [Plasmodium vivax]KMZ82343.1 hypothetical protein PVIIG_04457 [Plasmodium vivax India VII]KMZ86446.1 hypothetical protein PVBG_05314 [Plasmodium vivax Brazil I]KMZ92866.1 hypothetical protein PVMG_05426 [Plasmodium vivax Mauritania I]KMZ99379.1 hypothetical protein PVNG_05747 [Plasmodium vivax North Korean]EDL45847.1 hypothetical protein, conserved [Plasmodium vivax]|eukprot:XP_001615574.1 hypothetical protein [Plasmodium vivax Sal-1]